MMESPYLILLLLAVGVGAFATCLCLAARGSGQPLPEPGKDIPTESGKLNPEAAWSRYHVRYYGFALLFLAFDMEMAYMYPWAVVYQELGLMALLDMGVFLAILFLGLLYTWSQGGLKRQ